MNVWGGERLGWWTSDFTQGVVNVWGGERLGWWMSGWWTSYNRLNMSPFHQEYRFKSRISSQSVPQTGANASSSTWQLILSIEVPLEISRFILSFDLREWGRISQALHLCQFSLFIRFRHFELQLFWWDFGNQRSFARNTKFMKGSFEWGAMQFRGNIAEPIFDIVP